MTSSLDSSSSSTPQPSAPDAPGWLKLAVVASASVLAGGLAAAWWYKKTLTKLQQAEENPLNPHFGISEDEPWE